MPKSAKKRREKVADFSKAKLKLGKGKQAASNAIDTSFKARSIALPNQKIATERIDDAPTTHRKLTFDDLISHLKHYSPGTRRDAILGLKELLREHWELVDVNLNVMLTALTRLIGDEDSGVRRTLISLFTWLLRRLPSKDLVPHAPMLLLFTTSAQTHIFPEIRIDAVRFLDVFLEHIPETVVSGWESVDGHGSRVLRGYLGLLSAGTKFGDAGEPVTATSTAGVVLTPASKCVVLQSLATFLEKALPEEQYATSSPQSFPTWYIEPFFASRQAYEAFDKILRPSTCSETCHCWKANKSDWHDPTDLEDFMHNPVFDCESGSRQWSLQDILEAPSLIAVERDENSSHSKRGETLINLIKALHPTIISTLLDCSPAVFSPSANPPETELALTLAIARVSQSLYSAFFREAGASGKAKETISEDLAAFLGYLTPYFPFTSSGKREIRIEQSFQELNIIYCELTSLLLLSERPSATGKRQSDKQKAKSAAAVSTGLSSVRGYALELLSTENAGLQQLTPQAYTSLLPTIWALMSASSLDGVEVFHGVVRHATSVSSKATLKRPTVEFVARIILASTEPEFTWKLDRTAETAELVTRWITALPMVLWEIKAQNLPLTETIFRFLLRLAQRKPERILSLKTVADLVLRFIPYIGVTVLNKHKRPSGISPGPYAKLPAASSSGCSIRYLALSAIASLLLYDPELPAKEGNTATVSIKPSVDIAVSGGAEETYWKHIIAPFKSPYVDV